MLPVKESLVWFKFSVSISELKVLILKISITYLCISVTYVHVYGLYVYSECRCHSLVIYN